MLSKATIKRLIPPRLLNAILLAVPALYRTRLVNYETNLADDAGIENLLEQLDRVLPLSGDIIECGASRCGTTAIMADHLRGKGIRKKIFACDSFEGFDREELKREKAQGWTKAPEDAFTSTSFEYVKKKIANLGHSEAIVPVKGYFQETLPQMSGPLVLALVDCDLKDSLIYAGEQVWPRLVKGGRLLFDDYNSENWQGARQGVDEFVARHSGEIASSGLLSRLYYVEKK